MKLIIGGASGFVAQELLRQSLKRPEFTTIVALSRNPVTAPSDIGDAANAAKLRSVVVKDYGEYSDDVRKEFAGADACIWTVAITPTKSKMYDFKDVVRICQAGTIEALKAMYEAGVSKPFRFLYMAGMGTERDQTKTPDWMPQYSLMRGETENRVLAFAKEHKGEVEASVAKPGLITAPGRPIASIFATVAGLLTTKMKFIERAVLAKALLDQVIDGFESDALTNEDLIRLGSGKNESTT